MIAPQLSFQFSRLANRLRKSRDGNKELKQFNAMKEDLAQVPPKGKDCLLVRLDDIGDFLLFVPVLKAWLEQMPIGKKIHFLGNMAWKELFNYFFPNPEIETIWMDKNQWFNSSDYRKAVCNQLAKLSVNEIYFPSFTRVTLLEELIRCQFAAAHAYGWQAKPSPISKKLNEGFHFLLDSNAGDHELENNKHFFAATHPGKKIKTDFSFPSIQQKQAENSYFIVCPGGNQGSKRWKAENWALLAKHILQENPTITCLITGSKNDFQQAEIIRKMLEGFRVENICGKTSLIELLSLSASAQYCLSNDTAQAHFCALQQIPCFVVVNGNRYGRFFPYPKAFTKVKAVYPKIQKLSLNSHYDWEEKMPINALKPKEISSEFQDWVKESKRP